LEHYLRYSKFSLITLLAQPDLFFIGGLMKQLFIQRILFSKQMDGVPNEKSTTGNGAERGAKAGILFGKAGAHQINDNRAGSQDHQDNPAFVMPAFPPGNGLGHGDGLK
jgi:hypothetical protein